MTAVLVIAKAPVAGRVKTRLCPPCTPEQAAGLAEAALRDTLEAVAASGASRRVCVLDGAPGPWLPEAFEAVAQRGDGLDERLAAAFADALASRAEPAVLVGMDTPQVTPELIDDALDRLGRADAVLGLAPDGGYWAIGLHRADDALFRGVPMSAASTGARQLERLREHGLAVDLLDELVDVDTIEDARAVAASAPRSRFAAAVGRLDLAQAA